MNAGLDEAGVRGSILVLVLKRQQRGSDPLLLEPAATLKGLGISSLEVIELIFDVEECFDITFPDSYAGRIAGATLQNLFDATCEQLREKNAARDPA